MGPLGHLSRAGRARRRTPPSGESLVGPSPQPGKAVGNSIFSSNILSLAVGFLLRQLPDLESVLRGECGHLFSEGHYGISAVWRLRGSPVPVPPVPGCRTPAGGPASHAGRWLPAAALAGHPPATPALLPGQGRQWAAAEEERPAGPGRGGPSRAVSRRAPLLLHFSNVPCSFHCLNVVVKHARRKTCRCLSPRGSCG